MGKLATGAGPNGGNLRMGSCAFVDRPVNAFEMESIGTDWCGANHDLPLPAVISILDLCLGDRDCVAEVCINTYRKGQPSLCTILALLRCTDALSVLTARRILPIIPERLRCVIYMS